MRGSGPGERRRWCANTFGSTSTTTKRVPLRSSASTSWKPVVVYASPFPMGCFRMPSISGWSKLVAPGQPIILQPTTKLSTTTGLFVPVFTLAGFTVTLLEWWDERGKFHYADWDLSDGPIGRATKLDTRNEAWRTGDGSLGFTSLLLDAVRPPAHLPGK